MPDLRYPLSWPDGWPRARYREVSQFKVSRNRSHRELMKTIVRMGGKSIVLSTNLKLRKTDGLPLANQQLVTDPGVAVYFTRKKQEICIATDKYMTVRENIRALWAALEAMRTIERSGASELLDRAFQGFAKLPSAIVTVPPWRTTLNLPDAWPAGLLKVTAYSDLAQHYRYQVSRVHPDKGGSHEAVVQVNAAHDRAKQELKERFG